MNPANAHPIPGLRSAAAVLSVMMALPQIAGAQQPLWQAYKERFITAEGRVVDTANGDVSHSESQGYGLLLAQAHDDRPAFERIWEWTGTHLGVRDDALFAWRWVPGKGVEDRNNATDGDLLIAWALCRAADSWQKPEWRAAAAAIAKDVRTKMRVPSKFGDLLLPGGAGFKRDDGTIVNLSYWLFPAFVELDGIDPSPEWKALAESGLKPVAKARFSHWELPPDWLLVGRDTLSVAPGHEPDYGYNAIRVPLNLAWGGYRDAALYEPFCNYDKAAGGLPPRATVALPSGIPGKDPALPGMLAIYRLVSGTGDLEPAALSAPFDALAPDEAYFSASLGLLANLAASEADKFTKPTNP